MIRQPSIVALVVTLCTAMIAGDCSAANAPDSTGNGDAASPTQCTHDNATYSVLSQATNRCQKVPTEQSNGTPQTAPKETNSGIDDDWIAAEMLSFSVIGIAQLRGGTELLGNLWYASSVLIPPFLDQRARYGVTQNYLAIAPPCIVLGVTNGYLGRDNAASGRVFLINFVGFNVGLLWSRHILDKSRNPFDNAELTRKLDINANLVPLYDGAAMRVSMRW